MEIPDLNREPNAIVFAEQTYNGLEKDIVTIASTLLPNEEKAKEWPKNKEFEISFKVDLLSETNYTRIKGALENLNKKRIVSIDDDVKKASFSSIYPECSIENGVITINIRGRYVYPFSRLSSGYSVYAIKEYLSLNGHFPKRLFEMFSSYANRKINTLIVEVEILKRQLGVGDKYIGRPIDFKRKAILPALEQINEKTSLSINFSTKRERRKTMFCFAVEYKDKVDKNTGTQRINEPHQTPVREGVERNKKELNQTQEIAKRRAQDLDFTTKQIEEILRPDRVEWFNKWWFNNQSEIKGNWTAEIARGKYYGTIKA